MEEHKYPEPTVSALIMNQKDEFLLIKSPKWDGLFILPGGHIEIGETMESALHREILEETGLTIFDIKYISFREFIFGSHFYKKKHFIFFNFSCRTDSCDVTLNWEGINFIWTEMDQLHKISIEPFSLEVIQYYFRHNGSLSYGR